MFQVNFFLYIFFISLPPLSFPFSLFLFHSLFFSLSNGLKCKHFFELRYRLLMLKSNYFRVGQKIPLSVRLNWNIFVRGKSKLKLPSESDLIVLMCSSFVSNFLKSIRKQATSTLTNRQILFIRHSFLVKIYFAQHNLFINIAFHFVLNSTKLNLVSII